MDLTRRRFLSAALAVAAAPMIVRAASLMPVRALPIHPGLDAWYHDGILRPIGQGGPDYIVVGPRFYELWLAEVKKHCPYPDWLAAA